MNAICHSMNANRVLVQLESDGDTSMLHAVIKLV